MFRYVVLGLLHAGAQHHGYALMKAYRDRFGVNISTGNFYRDLQRLVAEGLVRTVERESHDDPRRAPYQITDAGRALFLRWFVNATAVFTTSGHEDQFAVRLAFLADVAPDDARRVLDFFQDELWGRAKSLERTRDATLAERERTGRDDFPVLALMLDRRIRRVAAEIAFLDAVRSTYDEWVSRKSRLSPPAPAEGARDARTRNKSGPARRARSG